jgi:hypothetical protein
MPGGLRGAGAAFISGGKLVDAGNAWIRAKSGGGQLDSVQLAKSMNPSGTLIVYSTISGMPPPDVNIPFDGNTYHVFSVSGSAAMIAFIDSVQSVDDLVVTGPSEGLHVPRNIPLTVTWSNGGADGAVKVTATVIANSDTTLKAAGAVVPDPNGSLQIPAAALGHLPPGGARLSIARYRLIYWIRGATTTGLLCESVEVRNISLD